MCCGSSCGLYLQKIVDRISDGYIIVNEDNRIIDFNKTFITMLDIHSKIRNQDFYEFIKNSPRESIETFETIKETFHQIKEKPNQTIVLDRFDKNLNKYFSVEISGIVSNRNFLGILILFKDTTQHMLDLQTISDNQETLMEKERLASLGQLIGGIAHNLKTPIMSISGAAEGLTDLIKEYETSIGDPEVTIEDHHEIAKDMTTWIAKIKTHTEYMSDVIGVVLKNCSLKADKAKHKIPMVKDMGVEYTFKLTIPAYPAILTKRGVKAPIKIKIDCLEKNPEF